MKREFLAGDRVYHLQEHCKGTVNLVEDDGILLIRWDDSRYTSFRYHANAIGHLRKKKKDAITLTFVGFHQAWAQASIIGGEYKHPSFLRVAEELGFLGGKK